MGVRVLNRRRVLLTNDSALRKWMRKLTLEQAAEVSRYADRMFQAMLDEGFDSKKARELSDAAAERKAEQLAKGRRSNAGDELEQIQEKINALVDEMNLKGDTRSRAERLRVLKERRDELEGLEELGDVPGWQTAEEAAYEAARKGSWPTYRNPERVTKRDVQYAAASYQNLVKEYGENNMATQRAYWKYLELQRAWDAQRGK